MSGISRDIQLDTKHISKHLPNIPQMQKLLQQEGFAHVFNDEITLQEVAQAIMESGEFIGTIHGHDRYGLFFQEPIGYRIDADDHCIPLHYGAIKVKGNRYHVIPRTKRSR